MDYRITELLEKKAFEELTEVEKSLVLDHLTEAEYREQHHLLWVVKKELTEEAKTLHAKDQIRRKALEALRMKQKKKKSKVMPLWLNYKIPLWSAVAAILLVFILTTPLITNTEINETKIKDQLVMRDTVYIEKLVNDTIEIAKPADTITKYIYVPKKISSPLKEGTNISELPTKIKSITPLEKELISSYEEDNSPIHLERHKTGKSLSEDPIARSVLNISQ